MSHSPSFFLLVILGAIGCAGDADGDGVHGDADCDDTNASVHTGATESCNAIDDNCDGVIDEGVTLTFYADGDGDGHGDALAPLVACSLPTGASADNTDCDDATAGAHPGADELCDSVDDDCDGAVDEEDATDAPTWYADADHDGYGDADTARTSCAAPSGTIAVAGDCDDAAEVVNPEAAETCNGFDDDCDSQIDESGAVGESTWYLDSDHDGFGDPAASVLACDAPLDHVADDADCDDGSASVNPDAVESCDGIDNDCDSVIDEAGATGEQSWYADTDRDGYGDPNASVVACDVPVDHVADSTDCAPADSTVHPGAPETCNFLDDDCDRVVDEGVATFADADGDGFASDAAAATCTTGAGYVGVQGDCNDADAMVAPGAMEACDGQQNDCSLTGWVTADEDGHVTWAASDGTVTDLTTDFGAGQHNAPALVTLPGDGVVTLCDGIYYVYLRDQVASDLTIRSLNGPGATEIEPDTKCGVTVRGAITVDGLRITQGSSGGGGGAGVLARDGSTVVVNNSIIDLADGSGMYGEGDSWLEIANTSLEGNVSLLAGAAVYAEGTLRVSGSTITDNEVTAVRCNGCELDIADTTLSGNIGQAISISQDVAKSVTVNNLTCEDNQTSAFGGCLAATVAGTFTITGGSFVRNVASSGGAISLGGDLVGCMIDGVTIEDNSAVQDGGGMDLSPSDLTPGPCDVRNAVFQRNDAGRYGGGLYYDGLEAEVTDSLFADNTADYGAGLYIDEPGSFQDVHAVLTGVELSGNIATSHGGGLATTGHQDIEIIDSDIHDNVAPTGGGLYLYGDFGGLGAVRVENTDIHANDADSGGGIDAMLLDTLTFDNVRIYDNTADTAAGLDGYAETITFTGDPNGFSGFERNLATVDAGGIYLNGDLTCTDCDFGTGVDDNVAGGVGSDIVLPGVATLSGYGNDETFTCTPVDCTP